MDRLMRLGATTLGDSSRRVGMTDGVGFEVVDVIPGRGYSFRELAVKRLANGA